MCCSSIAIKATSIANTLSITYGLSDFTKYTLSFCFIRWTLYHSVKVY